jgi:leader peptidase (prepilin peptidase)/N-methyltransferase
MRTHHPHHERHPCEQRVGIGPDGTLTGVWHQVVQHGAYGVALAALRRRPVAAAVGMVVVEALLILRIGADVALPAFLAAGVVGVLLAMVDLASKRLPNGLVLALYGSGLGLLTMAAAAQPAWGSLVRALGAMTVLFAVYLALALVNPAGLGLGDVKLAGALGLYLGWRGWDSVITGTLAAFVSVAAVALALLATRRAKRSSELPFGPFMLAGALLGVLTS